MLTMSSKRMAYQAAASAGIRCLYQCAAAETENLWLACFRPNYWERTMKELVTPQPGISDRSQRGAAS